MSDSGGWQGIYLSSQELAGVRGKSGFDLKISDTRIVINANANR